METVEFLLVSLVGLVVAASIAAAVVWYRRSAVARSEAVQTVPQHGRVVVLLDIGRAEPRSPATQRLVHEAAVRVFRTMPEATEVEVRSGAGVALGLVPRRATVPDAVVLPEMLLEPHARRSRTPDLSRHLGLQEGEPPTAAPGVAPTFSVTEPAPARPLADRFDLAAAVRARLDDPDDAVAIVRAILEVAGIWVRVDEDLVLAEDVAIVVAVPSGGVAVDHDLLNHAFLRIERSGATHGIVLGLGVLDAGEVRRRELASPHVLHAGPEGIQRMADAVAVGADPLRFAVAPVLSVLPEPVARRVVSGAR